MLSALGTIPAWQDFLAQIQAEPSTASGGSFGLMRSARFPITAALARTLGRPILYLTDRSSRAVLAQTELNFWSGTRDWMSFPAPEPLFYEQAAWGQSVHRERIQVLTQLVQQMIPGREKSIHPPLITASIRAAQTRSIDRHTFVKNCRIFKPEQAVSPTKLIRQWADIGYEAVDTVLEPGQFSKRGGLLDIWPLSADNPVRLDFFGDEIDTIYQFCPSSQRNEKKLTQIIISPAKEVILSERTDLERTPGIPSEFYIPLIHRLPVCLLDYMPKNTLILFDDYQAVCENAEELENSAESLRLLCIREETLSQDFPQPYISFSEICDELEGRSWINLGRSSEAPPHSISAVFEPAERFNGRIEAFNDYLYTLPQSNQTLTVISRQATRLEKMAADKVEKRITFIESSLSEGFRCRLADGSDWQVLTDSEIFGWERPTPRKAALRSEKPPEVFFADLKPGDYVVHVEYGIGQYSGLVSRTMDGIEKEFLQVAYAKGDQLFVPIHQADRLTNYIGANNSKPELTRLGTNEWIRTKDHVKENVLVVALDLLNLYAQRQVAKGFAFSADSAWQQDLEGAFPYEETQDQERAIKAVKQDMERTRPMDRLICGDVGFGKTEIALRAAFKAACDGKQTAILAPTTVLAQQHYETFRKRFAAYPITVDVLSRFRSAKEQDLILKNLAAGKIDVLIGTHRLISRDVLFYDLGLVVIDEEQRFGVAQKEHLKKLRTEIDVLTMTATPIPRTLYMALTGVRDISNVNTPPYDRVPILTHVGPFSEKIVRQAIIREMERGGQIFFVHNRVHSIYAIKNQLQRLVPDARIGVGHGQLSEKELSAVMDDFYQGNLDILLCTTIIEAGLDVPNANTLIVDRADTFGLAQLYQIRGRVGRSSQRAYAYFFRQSSGIATEDGIERLEVLAENTQFGAGYSIAMRDLEMRGAGEILGAKQSGVITAVGFHLYTRLLAQAVRSLRTERGFDIQDEEIGITRDMAFLFNPITVELPLDAAIPENYVSDQKMRIRLYRRLAAIHEQSALDLIRAEFQDRFGDLPLQTENLLFQLQVKILAHEMGVSAVVREGENAVLRYSDAEERRMPRLRHPTVREGKNCYRIVSLDWNDDSWKIILYETMLVIQELLASLFRQGQSSFES